MQHMDSLTLRAASRPEGSRGAQSAPVRKVTVARPDRPNDDPDDLAECFGPSPARVPEEEELHAPTGLTSLMQQVLVEQRLNDQTVPEDESRHFYDRTGCPSLDKEGADC